MIFLHEKYLEWICGYANAKGGTLYVGIEDGTKRPVGLKNPNKLMEDIPNTIRNTMGIVADVALLKKSGKDVIRVKVKPSAFPVSYRGDGRSKTYHDAYHVNDHENRPLTTSEFQLLTVLGQHGALSAADLRKAMKIKNSSDLRERYLRPLSRQGYVEFTIPGAARSRLQNYRLTDKGRMVLTRNSASPSGSNVESGNVPVAPPVMPPVVPPVATPVVTPVMTPVELPSEALLDDVQRKVLLALVKGEMATVMLAKTVGVTQAKNLRRRYLRLLLDARYIEYTIPAKPNSRLQQYRLTDKGRMFAERIRTAKKKGKSK